MSADGCVFCGYSDHRRIVADLGRVIVIDPLNPVTPGHLLFVPREHIENAAESPPLASEVFEKAAEWAATSWGGPCNLITSVGREATQTVMHLHVHLVPRRPDDGLALPWSEPSELAALRGELQAARDEAESMSRLAHDAVEDTIVAEAALQAARDSEKVLSETLRPVTVRAEQAEAALQAARDERDESLRNIEKRVVAGQTFAWHIARWLEGNKLGSGKHVMWARFPLGMVGRWIERAEAAEAALQAAQEALREARVAVVDIRDSSRWTPVSGARQAWARTTLEKIDAVLAGGRHGLEVANEETPGKDARA